VVQVIIVSVDPGTSGKNDSNAYCAQQSLFAFTYNLKMKIRLNNISTLETSFLAAMF
jgi:hypothetical protein